MADVDLTPTAEMARNAARGLELRREHGRGGTEVGVARARDISNGKTLSPETVRRMHAFFSRHAKNKAGGEDDAGYIAWMLWSGDAGRDWAKRKVDELDRKERNAMSETRKAIMERLGMAATNDRPGAKAKMAADAGMVARAIAEHNRQRRAYQEAKERLEALVRLGHSEQRIEQAERGVQLAEERMNEAAKALKNLNSRPGAKAKFEVLNANYAKMEVRYMKPDGQTETEIVSGSARAAVSSAIRRIEKMGDGAKVWVKAFVPAHPLGRFPAFENVIWKGEVKGGRAYEHGGAFSRPGAKVRAALADACWEGYEAVGTKPQDGKTVPNCVPKMKAGRAEDLYRKLSGGTITNANVREWDRLVTEALRMPDFTPPGGDMSLHEIAEELGGEIMALKSRAAKAQAAKPAEGDLEREDVKAGLKLMSASDPAVSDKIRTLIKEGKPQDQAVAIALDMKRRGEL